jgi:hypothetical protein
MKGRGVCNGAGVGELTTGRQFFNKTRGALANGLIFGADESGFSNLISGVLILGSCGVNFNGSAVTPSFLGGFSSGLITTRREVNGRCSKPAG